MSQQTDQAKPQHEAKEPLISIFLQGINRAQKHAQLYNNKDLGPAAATATTLAKMTLQMWSITRIGLAFPLIPLADWLAG